jgi:hypothetical protein
MAGEQQQGMIEVILAAMTKLWPGLFGALVALRWQPADATRLDRAIAGFGGFAASMYVGPLISEVVGISSLRVEAGVIFLVGLFSMVVAGEIMLAARSVGLGEIARDWIRSVLRVKKEGE